MCDDQQTSFVIESNWRKVLAQRKTDLCKVDLNSVTDALV